MYYSDYIYTRDAFIVAFTNCATSVFAAIIIFGIMGFKVYMTTFIILYFNSLCVGRHTRLLMHV